MVVHPGGPLRGELHAIGDKSMTHRSLILAGIARGISRINHPNPGRDCDGTARAMERLGALVQRTEAGWEVTGAGGKLRDPDDAVDLGNAGTGIRLVAGLVAGQPVYAVLTGDASLRRRPMRRIAEPLRAMGATVLLRESEYPPIAIRGGNLRALSYRLPIASAQVKSCLLLAGLGVGEGELVLEEPGPSRDHTERLFSWLGLPITCDGPTLRLRAPVALHDGFCFTVPSDPSAAAFFLVAASITPGSDLLLEGVSLNPTRTGILDVLKAMGADLAITEEKTDQPEPIGAIRVRASSLRGVTIDGPLLVRTMDEIPVVAVAATAAEGETLIRDARELRVKESDRLESTASLVRCLGGDVELGDDWMRIAGRGFVDGGQVEAHGDHRIAMSAIVAGCAARGAVHLDDTSAIATSDPTFLESVRSLGVELA
jgi:3-phosphoshikimate 1-carboxyvinyltransferase